MLLLLLLFKMVQNCNNALRRAFGLLRKQIAKILLIWTQLAFLQIDQLYVNLFIFNIYNICVSKYYIENILN